MDTIDRSMRTQHKTVQKTVDAPVENKGRNLFFDILRIAAVILIVVHHLPGMPIPVDSTLYRFIYDNGVALTYHVTAGPLGVYLLVFISGAVVHYAYGNRKVSSKQFIYSRLKRLYPSYWIVIVGYFLFSPELILRGKGFFWQLTGFLPGVAYCSWWIGLFLCLYLVYPILRKAIKAHPYITLLSAFVITIASRLLVAGVTGKMPGTGLDIIQLDRLIFPTLLFEFVLGMVVIEKGLYFKRAHHSRVVAWLSEVSFFVFLLHPLTRNAMFGSDMSQLWHPRNFLFYLLVTILLSAQLMSLDRFIQKILPHKLPNS